MFVRAPWLALMLVGVSAACGGQPPAAEDAPSVVLITIDTLRADRMSLYGHTRPTTPQIDEFASGGVVFDAAASAGPCTVPAHASMLTGRYPGFHSAGSSNGGYKVLADEVTLAEVFADRGYFTAAVVSNPVLNHRLGLAQGFAIYDDELPEQELNRDNNERLADQAVDRALEVLAEAGDRPYFLWLHLQDPHGPYTPPAGWRSEWRVEVPGPQLTELADQSGDGGLPSYQVLGDQRDAEYYALQYDREIAYADHHLGRFLDALEQDGVFDEGLVILTSDHGEAIGEDDYWFAHCVSVSSDQIHVPLVMRGRGVDSGARVASPVSNVAIFRTFLDFVGADQIPSTPVPIAGSRLERFVPEPLSMNPDGAVYAESLNQIGVIGGGALLRWDRYPPDNEFWSAGNPNTHGPWRPLGTSLEGFAGQGVDDTDVAHAALAPLLRSYEAEVVRTERALADSRQTTRLPKGVEDALRAIGYIQ